MYVLLADVNEDEFQNAQELASVWGEIRTDIEQQGGDLMDAYALIGSHDFLLLVDVDDPEAALRIAIAVERHGIDTTTTQGFAIERLARIIEDI